MSSCHRLESWPSSGGSSRIPRLLYPTQEHRPTVRDSYIILSKLVVNNFKFNLFPIPLDGTKPWCKGPVDEMMNREKAFFGSWKPWIHYFWAFCCLFKTAANRWVWNDLITSRGSQELKSGQPRGVCNISFYYCFCSPNCLKI